MVRIGFMASEMSFENVDEGQTTTRDGRHFYLYISTFTSIFHGCTSLSNELTSSHAFIMAVSSLYRDEKNGENNGIIV